MEKITALYCRFAYSDTPDVIDEQEALLYNFAVEKGFTNIKGYVDNGVSGLIMDRPAFNELMADIEAGLVSCVIAADESRICRRSSVSSQYIEEIFPSHGVTFYAAASGKGKSLMDVLTGENS